MNIQFLKYRKIYFIFSGILVLISLVCLIVFGLNFGIDFVGGSLLEIEFNEARPLAEEIRERLKEENGEIVVQFTGERGVILRMREIDTNTKGLIVQKLREAGELTVMSFTSIGPIIGREIREKTIIIVILAVLAITFYIALAFRKISRPISSWQYGIAALLALFHDIFITLGVFSILGFLYQAEVNVPIITALLVVLGYSINDTVVVFDRIRENLIKKTGVTYEETVNKSLNETLFRSINTSLTTLFVLIPIFFFGGETLKYFALALIVGISAGVYSSIFLASPILVAWLRLRKKHKSY